MNSTTRTWTIISYLIVIAVLLAAFGFTLAYTLGDQLRLPFGL